MPVAEKFSFSNLKIEKVKFLTQDPTISALAFCTFGDCLASCLTFRTFLTLDPQHYTITHRVLKSHRSKMSVIYMQSWQ